MSSFSQKKKKKKRFFHFTSITEFISLVQIIWVAWALADSTEKGWREELDRRHSHSSLRNLPPLPINHYLPLAQADGWFDTHLPLAISASTQAKSLIALFFLLLINPKQFFCNEIWHLCLMPLPMSAIVVHMRADRKCTVMVVAVHFQSQKSCWQSQMTLWSIAELLCRLSVSWSSGAQFYFCEVSDGLSWHLLNDFI